MNDGQEIGTREYGGLAHEFHAKYGKRRPLAVTDADQGMPNDDVYKGRIELGEKLLAELLDGRLARFQITFFAGTKIVT